MSENYVRCPKCGTDNFKQIDDTKTEKEKAYVDNLIQNINTK